MWWSKAAKIKAANIFRVLLPHSKRSLSAVWDQEGDGHIFFKTDQISSLPPVSVADSHHGFYC